MFARQLNEFPGFGLRNMLAEMERFRCQMDALSGLAFRGAPHRAFATAGVFPLINLTEDAGRYYVRAELPGLKAEDLDIQAVGRGVTISGERKIASEGENVRYHRREREAGKFSRIVELPGEINADDIKAQLTNGVLTVTVAKSEAAKPRKITIS